MKQYALPIAIGLIVLAVVIAFFAFKGQDTGAAYSSAVSKEIKSDPTAPLAAGPKHIIGRESDGPGLPGKGRR